MRVLRHHLHTSLLGHLHDGGIPLFPKGFRVIFKGQAGHPPFLWRENLLHETLCGEEGEAGDWVLGAQLRPGKEQSKSGDLSEWAAEHARDSDLNWNKPPEVHKV